MGEPTLSDIVGGNDLLEGEEATRGNALAGEEALSAEAGGGDESAASDSTPAKEPKSKGEDASAAKAAKAADKGATPAPAADDDGDDGDATDPHPVPRKALIGERKKRQEAESKLSEATGRLSALEQIVARMQQQPQAQQQHQAQAQQQAQQKDPNDLMFAHEKGIAGFMDEQMTAREKALEQKMQAAIGGQRIELAREMMRSAHDDFDEAEAEFFALAKANPTLVQQVNAHRNPPQAAYQFVQAYRKIRGMGSIDELTAKIREEERAKIREELRRETADAAATRVSTSSAGARSAGTAPVHSNDIPLSEIVGQ